MQHAKKHKVVAKMVSGALTISSKIGDLLPNRAVERYFLYVNFLVWSISTDERFSRNGIVKKANLIK
ncbi:hypothetical protein F1C16_15940 [Hymenobacter sp. NBH84]|uniref:hypothetical protein n=1 Tax=Hymenobacter sp. NBH84 TaxID=2596915 RepID=UPI0016284236|nr:hypothetical protein [Hymenobacter sp. NBH84]QNE40949.1 hypothetical protein F1C16_15940 [Hymenobacter sp. NBH84]